MAPWRFSAILHTVRIMVAFFWPPGSPGVAPLGSGTETVNFDCNDVCMRGFTVQRGRATDTPVTQAATRG